MKIGCYVFYAITIIHAIPDRLGIPVLRINIYWIYFNFRLAFSFHSIGQGQEMEELIINQKTYKKLMLFFN